MGSGRAGGSTGWNPQERKPLSPLFHSILPLSLSAGGPAAVSAVLGLEGQWRCCGERSPQRGFAAWPGRERAGQRGGTPCTQGTCLRLPPAARNHMVRFGDCLLVLSHVLKWTSHKHASGSCFRDWEFCMWDRSLKNKMNLRRFTKMVGNFFNRSKVTQILK